MGEKYYCNECFSLFESNLKTCINCQGSDIREFSGPTHTKPEIGSAQGSLVPKVSKRRSQDGRTIRPRRFTTKWNLRPILVFVVSSAILTLVLNSTIWAYEGNPLGVQGVLSATKERFEEVATNLNAKQQEQSLSIDDLRKQELDKIQTAQAKITFAGAYFEEAANSPSSTKMLVFNLEYKNENDYLSCHSPSFKVQDSDAYVYETDPVFEWGREVIPCLNPGQLAYRQVAFKVPVNKNYYDLQIHGIETTSVRVPKQEILDSDPGFLSKPNLSTNAPGLKQKALYGDLELTLQSVQVRKVTFSGSTPEYVVDFDLVAKNRGKYFISIQNPSVFSGDGYFYRTEFKPQTGSDDLTSPMTFGGVPGGETRRSTFTARLNSPTALQLQVRGYPSDEAPQLVTTIIIVSADEMSRAARN